MKPLKTRKKLHKILKKLSESKSVIPNLFKNRFQQHFNGIKYQREDGVTEIYYVGIIDVLIQYQGKKRIEGFIKSVAYAGEEVSVSQPSYYASRFYKFMRDIIGKPPNEPESSSSSSEFEEEDVLGDLPEPGSGEIIRPEQPPAPPEKDKRNPAMSTGQGARDSKRGITRGGTGGANQPKALDKGSIPPGQ